MQPIQPILFRVVLALPAMVGVAYAQLPYYQDFQGVVGPEWSSSKTTAVNSAGTRRILGNFSNETVTLSSSGLIAGQRYGLSFEFFALGSWDGTGNVYAGPDLFTVAAGSSKLLDATFSVLNEEDRRQSYSPGNLLPGAGGGGTLFPAYTGADEIDPITLPQFNWYGLGNAVWHFDGTGMNPSLGFIATGTGMTLSFAASGLQTQTDPYYGLDESWGIDNVKVFQAVPEPTPLEALGVGALALLRRRRAV